MDKPDREAEAENNERTLERVAEAIRDIGNMGARMERAGLSRRAILVLLADETRLSRRNLGVVLDALPNLPSWALSKKAPKAK